VRRVELYRLMAGERASPAHALVFTYDEPALAALVLSIATTNVFNRLNVATRQVAGAWS